MMMDMQFCTGLNALIHTSMYTRHLPPQAILCHKYGDVCLMSVPWTWGKQQCHYHNVCSHIGLKPSPLANPHLVYRLATGEEIHLLWFLSQLWGSCIIFSNLSQYHGCWWPGNAKSQGINSQGGCCCPDSLYCQVISNHSIDHVSQAELCLPCVRVSTTCSISSMKNDIKHQCTKFLQQNSALSVKCIKTQFSNAYYWLR